MKITAVCDTCEREFLLGQLVESQITGRCPWCGEFLVPGYLATLPELVRRAETSGSELVRVLGRLGGEWTRFRIRAGSVLGPLEQALAGEEKPPVRLRRAA